MTEEQKKLKAERDRRYREKKKLEKAAEADLQAPVDPAPESSMQSPVIGRQVPPPCVVEGHPDDLPPVKIEPEMITYFDVYKRRHEEMFK
jgi:hypothetical protein